MSNKGISAVKTDQDAWKKELIKYENARGTKPSKECTQRQTISTFKSTLLHIKWVYVFTLILAILIISVSIEWQ